MCYSEATSISPINRKFSTKQSDDLPHSVCVALVFPDSLKPS